MRALLFHIVPISQAKTSCRNALAAFQATTLCQCDSGCDATVLYQRGSSESDCAVTTWRVPVCPGLRRRVSDLLDPHRAVYVYRCQRWSRIKASQVSRCPTAVHVRSAAGEYSYRRQIPVRGLPLPLLL